MRKKFDVTCITIWTEGNFNPFILESRTINGKNLWWIHEEYDEPNVTTYDAVDFIGTYAECLKVMNKYLELKVKE